MKKTGYILSLAVCFGTVTACSEQQGRNDLVVLAAYNAQNPNPTNDPDVWAGFDRHQQEYRDRQAAAREAEQARQAAAAEAEQTRQAAAAEAEQARQAAAAEAEGARNYSNYSVDIRAATTGGSPPPKQNNN